MQSSQSSATVAFRALLMLAFLIGIPLIAFNGSALPDKARQLLNKAWPAISSAISATKANILTEAPPYDAKSQNLLSVPSQTLSGTSNPPAQLGIVNQPNPLPVDVAGVNIQGLRPPSANVIPANYQCAVEPQVNIPGNNNQAATDHFIAIQDRLRQLGATYYLLETWGNQRQLYRFYCQMAVGGNSNYTRYFEATNANPLEAMADVLRQVEAWRGGGESIR